jgi:hypothetical protein
LPSCPFANWNAPKTHARHNENFTTVMFLYYLWQK